MLTAKPIPPGIKLEFRLWCVRHQNGEIEIFGWVQSVEQFHEMMRTLYNEVDFASSL